MFSSRTQLILWSRGSLVSLTPSLDAHAMVHPGVRVDGSAAEALSSPTCLLPSMNEDAGKVGLCPLQIRKLLTGNSTADGSVP